MQEYWSCDSINLALCHNIEAKSVSYIPMLKKHRRNFDRSGISNGGKKKEAHPITTLIDWTIAYIKQLCLVIMVVLTMGVLKLYSLINCWVRMNTLVLLPHRNVSLRWHNLCVACVLYLSSMGVSYRMFWMVCYKNANNDYDYCDMRKHPTIMVVWLRWTAWDCGWRGLHDGAW